VPIFILSPADKGTAAIKTKNKLVLKNKRLNLKNRLPPPARWLGYRGGRQGSRKTEDEVTETQYVQIKNLLTDIYQKVAKIEVEVEVLRGEVSSLKTNQTPKEFSNEELKAEFEGFKDQWQSDSPEIQGLKEGLLKLRASLGGLSQALSQQETETSLPDQKS
jgi:chromosome segregation ATPase